MMARWAGLARRFQICNLQQTLQLSDTVRLDETLRWGTRTVFSLILLVDADRAVLKRTEELLAAEGHLVIAVSSFQEAKSHLYTVSPDLLIADVRLDAFNGLHLAARARIDYPKLPVIITHASADRVLEREAERQGAAFVVKPLENPDFLTSVQSALDRHRHAQTPIRRWPRKQVSGLVEAQLEASHVRICDMSYGGLKLALGDERELPSVFDVTVPTTGLTVHARPVWTFRSPVTDEFWCGAELIETEGAAMTEWRDFVDSTQ
jgi:FixJ family two-component response regulator